MQKKRLAENSLQPRDSDAADFQISVAEEAELKIHRDVVQLRKFRQRPGPGHDRNPV